MSHAVLALGHPVGGIKRSNPFVYGSPTVGWEHAEY